MESSLVKIDNIMSWDGAKTPFVEHYTLYLHGPKAAWALCLRFSFLIEDSHKKQGFVEAFFQTQDGQKIHLKKKWDLDRFDVVHADKFIEMGDSGLSLSDCMGLLSDKNHTIKWECRFEDPVLSFRPYPDYFYPFSFPRYKMMYPRFLNFARGVIYVDHKKYEFNRLRVSQTHGFGPFEPKPSLFAQCLEFEEDSEASLLVYAPRFGKNKKLPYFPCATLYMEGEWYDSASLWNFFKQKNWYLDDQSWHFEFQKRPFVFRVAIESNPDFNFSLPDGFVMNNFAHTTIEVFKKTSQGFQNYKVLTANRKASLLRSSPN